MADRTEELRRRLEKDPGSRLFAQLAEQLRKDGELEEAILVARAGLEGHPNYPSARLTLGRALLDSGDAAAARSELEAAVRGAPDNILASRLLGQTLEELGDLPGALKRLKATLLIAPGDGQIEARIAEIERRLGQPQGPEEPAREDHTAPMQAVKPPRAATSGAAPPGGRPPAAAAGSPGPPPPPEAGPPGAEGVEGEGGGALPPTIRIRMPGDPVGGVRAPMPPSEGSAARASVEETTVPPPPKEDGEEAGGEPRIPAPSEEGASSGDQAPTLPGSRAAELAGAEDLPPTVPPGSMTSEATDRPATGAKTSPEPEKPGPPTAAAGDVTAPQGLDARNAASTAAPSREAPLGARLVAEASASPPPVSPAQAAPPATPDAGGPTPAPEPSPPADPTGSAETPPAPVDPGQGDAAGSMAPLLDEGAPAAPVGETALAPSEDRSGQRLSSATLAELYLEQGLLERAIEVYREVISAEPGNEAARARVVELEASLEASGTEAAPPDGLDERELKRRTLERTIGRLEALLEIVRRR